MLTTILDREIHQSAHFSDGLRLDLDLYDEH